MTAANDTNPRGIAGALLRGFDAVVDAATAILFLTGAVAMFAMVVTRYGFDWSDPSVEILVRYSMVWGTFVGMSAGIRHGINIRFTLLEHLLSDRGKIVIRTIAHLLTLAIAIGLALSGYALAKETMMFNEVMPTSLRWHVWPFHASICAGGVLLSLQVIRAIVDLWRTGIAPEDDALEGI